MRFVLDGAGDIGGLAWSRDGRLLAEAGGGPVIRIRDASSGAVALLRDETSGQKAAHAELAFGPDQVLYACFRRQVIRYRGEVRTRVFGDRSGARRRSPPSLELSESGDVLLTGDGQGIDLASNIRLANVSEPDWVVDAMSLSAVALFPEGDRGVAAWNIDHQRHHSLAVGVFSTRTGTTDFWLAQGDGPPADRVWVSADSRWVFALNVIPDESRRLLRMFPVNPLAGRFVAAGETHAVHLPIPGRESDAVRRGASAGWLAFAANGRRLVHGAGNQIEIHDMSRDHPSRWERALTEELPMEEITRLAVAPDGATIAVADQSGRLAVLEAPW